MSKAKTEHIDECNLLSEKKEKNRSKRLLNDQRLESSSMFHLLHKKSKRLVFPSTKDKQKALDVNEFN